MRGLLSFLTPIKRGMEARTGLFISTSLPDVTKRVFAHACRDFPGADFTVIAPNSYRSLFPDRIRFISNEDIKSHWWTLTRSLRRTPADLAIVIFDGRPLFRRPKLWAFLTNYRTLWLYHENGNRLPFHISSTRLLLGYFWAENRSSQHEIPEVQTLSQAKPSRPACNICGAVAEFLDTSQGTNLRESLVCPSCGSTSRDRMLIHALGMALGNKFPLRDWSPNPSFRILETVGYRGYPCYLAAKFDYYNTKYDPEKIAGGANPRYYADVQSLPYPGEFFDCVLSSDVFEHVRLDHLGFGEIFRVLKAGGIFVLQVPYGHNIRTRVLVEPRGEADVFLEPPQYHAEQTLVYRIYGHDLLDHLNQLGFSVVRLRIAVPGLGISEQDTFLSRKGTFVELSSR